MGLLHQEINLGWTRLWLLEAVQERSGGRVVLLGWSGLWCWILWWSMVDREKEPFWSGVEWNVKLKLLPLRWWLLVVWMDGLIHTVVKFLGLKTHDHDYHWMIAAELNTQKSTFVIFFLSKIQFSIFKIHVFIFHSLIKTFRLQIFKILQF